MHVARAISREEMAELPIRRYEGDVCLVQTLRDVERALEDFRSEHVVGFDTETRPTFKKGDRHLPSLIQAATARVVYLFRLREPVDCQVPAEMVASADILKVGIGLTDDLRALRLLHPFEEKSMLDLGNVARKWGMAQTGVRNLAGIFLGIRIPKGAQTSNWAAATLTSAQIQYAATDAWICRELFLHFRGLGMVPGPSAGQ
jgi:ribonuclease D